jgi:tetratricopeptide (TPR) repeat protein/predicted aspartyl protease
MRPRVPTALALLTLALCTPPGTPALAACKFAKVAELPVTLANMKPLVTAKINGTEVPFILDSGAFYSMISPETASELKLRLSMGPPNLSVQGVGGKVSASVATIDEFIFAGATFHHAEFIVGGTDFDRAGLLGQNFLHELDVEYDLANGVIRLWHPQDCRNAMLAYWLKPEQSYSMMNIQWGTLREPHTKGSAFVNGAEIEVMFDTGASTSLLSMRAAARAGLKPGDPGVVSAGYSYGLGRESIASWIGPFASFKIGDEEIRNTRLRFADIRTRGLDADMLLGADFFLSHRVYVAQSQHRLYFSYNGGPVFNLSSQPGSASRETAPGGDSPQPEKGTAQPGSTAVPPGETAAGQPGTGASAPAAAEASHSLDAFGSAEPTDASGFGRRGAAYLSRRDFQHAIADLTRACELDSSQPLYFYDRAMAHLGNKQPALAGADLDQAIKLKPDDVPALMARANLRFSSHQQAAAITDLDAADRAAPKEAHVRLSLGGLYQNAGLFAPAIAQYDLWIAAHGEDARKGEGLFQRCRARALWGQDLEKALSDCNASLGLSPKEAKAPILETRGLVRLRRGELDKSLADYSESLKLFPKNPWALYGQALAKIRKGMSAAGQADLAAAQAIAPRIGEEFIKLGIAAS